jgi:hypothetical protein
MDVQQHHGGPLTLDRGLGFGKCRRLADGKPFELEVDADEDTDCRIVVDDERAQTSDHASMLTTTIPLVTARTGTDQLYADELGELWTALLRTLSRLDLAASEPGSLDADGALQSLRRLQYSLHVSSEHVVGLVPPPGNETAHCELEAALLCARDATAEVAEAVSAWGAAGVEPLLHEWRGALFRVRLARMRLIRPDRTEAVIPVEEYESQARPLVAFLLALFGAVAFVGGAATGTWPIWAAGMLAVSASVFVYRP